MEITIPNEVNTLKLIVMLLDVCNSYKVSKLPQVKFNRFYTQKHKKSNLLP